VAGTRLLRPALWIAVGGVSALCGLLLVYTVDPAEAGFYPPCWLHRLTGWHCPGCGSTRALHAILHGDLPQALAFNPVFVLLVPAIGVGLLWRGQERWRGRPPRTRPLLSGGLIVALAAALVAFGILRNVPGWPFELLAPHQIVGRGDDDSSV
jgi:hypothetical protein